jgi:hypothetical protein
MKVKTKHLKREEMSENKQRDDDVNLIDFFVVLLCYRKVIILGTLCAIILAVAGYFFYPAYQYYKVVNSPVSQGRMLISVNPLASDYFSQKPETFFYQANVIADSLQQAGMLEYENSDEETVSLVDSSERQLALSYIDKDFVKANDPRINPDIEENRYRVKPFAPTGAVNNTNSSILEISFKDEDPEFVKSFLSLLLAANNANIKNIIMPVFEGIVSNYERLLNMPNMSQSLQQVLELGLNDYMAAKDFIEDKQSVLIMIEAPTIVNEIVSIKDLREDFRTKGLFLIFAGALFSVLIAFVLNSIKNVKKDEVSMKKINDALGKSNEA